MVETQKIHEKFKLSCIGMTYPKAFWRFMETFFPVVELVLTLISP